MPVACPASPADASAATAKASAPEPRSLRGQPGPTAAALSVNSAPIVVDPATNAVSAAGPAGTVNLC
jgi:hypothetical protein